MGKKRPDGEAYDLKDMERELALTSYAGAALGCAAFLGCTILVSLTQLVLGGNFGALGRLLAGAGTWAALGFLAVFFVLRGRISLPGRVRAYRYAADYFELSRRGPARAVIAGSAWAAGFFAAVYMGASFSGNGYWAQIFMDLAAVAAFLTALWGFERRKTGKTRVEQVEGGVDFDPVRERRRALLRWGVYWAAVLGVYAVTVAVFKSFVLYAPVLVFAGVNCALRLAVLRPGPYASLKRRRVTVRILNFMALAVTALAAAFVIFTGVELNNPYIARLDYSVFEHHTSVSYDPDSGVYTLKADHEGFKILQLTDTHIGGSVTTVGLDRRAFDACYDIIKRTQPDLIIITGDLVYPAPEQSFSTNNMAAMNELVFFMNSVGIPWAMEYGNHDTQSSANYDGVGISRWMRQWATDVYEYGSLLYAGVQPEVYGRYNQYIRIENPDGSLERVCFLIDSNDYLPGGVEISEYDNVHPDQIEWYRESVDEINTAEGRAVPSFVFMHIPFKEFEYAAKGLENGDPECEYLFGENGEGVSCPEGDDGFFEAILEKKSTEAVFVGHDHLNNMAVKYKGVDLVYSKSIDFLAYPGIAHVTSQRGGTLITLDGRGGYELRQVGCEVVG